MAELLAAPSPQIVFDNSLPLNLLLTLALVPAVEQFVGLDEWLREAHSALPAGLCQEIALLTRFPGGHLRFVEAVAARTLRTEEQVHAAFAEWTACLESLPPADFQTMACQALRHGIAEETVALQDLQDPSYLVAFLRARDPGRDPALAVNLVLDPAGLKERFLKALGQFWGQLYQAAYEECLLFLEGSVTYHRTQSYSLRFDALFLAVTGRTLPAAVRYYLPEIHHVRFVPSCYLGLHVAFFRAGAALTIFYGCRGALLAERGAGAQVYHSL